MRELDGIGELAGELALEQGHTTEATPEEVSLICESPPAQRGELLAALRKARELKPGREVLSVVMEDGRPNVHMSPATEGAKSSALLEAYRAEMKKAEKKRIQKITARDAARRRASKGHQKAKAARKARRGAR